MKNIFKRFLFLLIIGALYASVNFSATALSPLHHFNEGIPTDSVYLDSNIMIVPQAVENADMDQFISPDLGLGMPIPPNAVPTMIVPQVAAVPRSQPPDPGVASAVVTLTVDNTYPQIHLGEYWFIELENRAVQSVEVTWLSRRRMNGGTIEYTIEFKWDRNEESEEFAALFLSELSDFYADRSGVRFPERYIMLHRYTTGENVERALLTSVTGV